MRTAASPREASIDLLFKSLSHRARRDMVARLANGELTIGELAAASTAT